MTLCWLSQRRTARRHWARSQLPRMVRAVREASDRADLSWRTDSQRTGTSRIYPMKQPLVRKEEPKIEVAPGSQLHRWLRILCTKRFREEILDPVLPDAAEYLPAATSRAAGDADGLRSELAFRRARGLTHVKRPELCRRRIRQCRLSACPQAGGSPCRFKRSVLSTSLPAR